MANTVHIRWLGGNESSYDNREEAASQIGIAYAETDINPIEDVWEIDEDGNEINLGCSWQILLYRI